MVGVARPANARRIRSCMPPHASSGFGKPREPREPGGSSCRDDGCARPRMRRKRCALGPRTQGCLRGHSRGRARARPRQYPGGTKRPLSRRSAPFARGYGAGSRQCLQRYWNQRSRRVAPHSRWILGGLRDQRRRPLDGCPRAQSCRSPFCFVQRFHRASTAAVIDHEHPANWPNEWHFARHIRPRSRRREDGDCVASRWCARHPCRRKTNHRRRPLDARPRG